MNDADSFCGRQMRLWLTVALFSVATAEKQLILPQTCSGNKRWTSKTRGREAAVLKSSALMSTANEAVFGSVCVTFLN